MPVEETGMPMGSSCVVPSFEVNLTPPMTNSRADL